MSSKDRAAGARRASKILDDEQMRRVQEDQENEEYEKLERKQNQRRASRQLDMEQARRISELADEKKQEEDERMRAAKEADRLQEEERQRRLDEDKKIKDEAEEERQHNRRKSLRLMDEERERREKEETVHRGSNVNEISEALQGLPLAANQDDDEEKKDTYQVSSKATGNIDDLLNKDADDESLQKYKESLLGAAAAGDLGDPNDPRRLIVTEFRVEFEEDQPDQIFHLDTEEGIEQLRTTGLKMKSGASWRFHLFFRVQHEIIAGVKFLNKTSKGIFSNNGEIMLGSYAPASEPHSFVYPRQGWNEAPKSMMMRGKFTATDTFADSDGNVHLSYTYPVQISKKW